MVQVYNGELIPQIIFFQKYSTTYLSTPTAISGFLGKPIVLKVSLQKMLIKPRKTPRHLTYFLILMLIICCYPMMVVRFCIRATMVLMAEIGAGEFFRQRMDIIL